MAALTTFTSTTDLTEMIETEKIDDLLYGFNRPPPTYMQVARLRPGQGNIPVRFIKIDDMDLSSVADPGQTVDATDFELTTSESSITPALLRFRVPIPDEVVAAVGNTTKVPAQLVIEAVTSFEDEIDIDGWAVTTGATQQTGALTTVFTMQGLRSAKAYAKSVNLPSGPMGLALVLHTTPAGTLDESLGSTGATLARVEGDFARFGWESGFQGRFHDIAVFESPNVAADSPGHSNVITPIGISSGLGAVVNEMPNVRVTRGDDAELRATTYFNIRAWFGVGIINPTRVVEILTT